MLIFHPHGVTGAPQANQKLYEATSNATYYPEAALTIALMDYNGMRSPLTAGGRCPRRSEPLDPVASPSKWNFIRRLNNFALAVGRFNLPPLRKIINVHRLFFSNFHPISLSLFTNFSPTKNLDPAYPQKTTSFCNQYDTCSYSVAHSIKDG